MKEKLKEKLKEAFRKGWDASHECATDYDYEIALSSFLYDSETEEKPNEFGEVESDTKGEISMKTLHEVMKEINFEKEAENLEREFYSLKDEVGVSKYNREQLLFYILQRFYSKLLNSECGIEQVTNDNL